MSKRGKMKKGMFFTIDGILAAGIVFGTIIFSSSFYAEEQPTFHISYLSQDLMDTLSAANVAGVNNGYINSLISDGSITNLKNTVVDQIVEFWAEGDIDRANKTAGNVTEPLVPDTNGFSILIDEEAIYSRDKPLTKSLASSKRIVSGIAKGQQTAETRNNPPTLFGPVVAEIRVWQ